MSKKLYILPGWGERITDKNYRQLISACPEFNFIPVKITTRNPKLCLGKKTLNKILDFLTEQIKEPNTVVGFSVGALLAYLVASRVKPQHLILCSLPPMIGKDLTDTKYLTDEQISELSAMDYPNYPATIFYGSKEIEKLKKVSKKFGGIEITGAEHKLEGEYLKTVIGKIKG